MPGVGNKALGYARVSLESENIENQVRAIEDFAHSSGLELLSVFRDIGVSGSQPALEREGFKKMIDVAEALGIKAIVVYDLTRLGRDVFDVVETYKYLLEHGYQVFFVKHPELNPGPSDSPINEAIRKAVLALLAVVAEMERAFISERTKVGMARAKAEGRRIGRKPVDIPMNLIRKYLSMGLSIRDVYRLLKDQGHLAYTDRKGNKHVLSYVQFWRRVRALNLARE